MNLSRAFIVRAHRGVLCTLAVGALAGALSGCVTRVVEQRPVVVERPAPQATWVPGHWVWRWNGGGWQWERGHWQR